MILIANCHDSIPFELSNDGTTIHNLEISRENKYTRGIARVFLNMLPHTTYEIYRQDVRRREQHLAAETSKNAPNPQEVTKRFIALENAHDVSSPRSLQQLCRLRLYRIINKVNHIPWAVIQVEMSHILRKFLSLDVQPCLGDIACVWEDKTSLRCTCAIHVINSK
jgi:hypothetical protein